MKSSKTIKVDIEKCTGCRSCELACSFQNLKVFDPSKSNVKIFRDDEKGVVEIHFSSSCDGCLNAEDRQIPLCIRFCGSGCLSLHENAN